MASKKGISQITSCRAQTKLDAKLLAYCAATSGALVAAPPAQATIVYSGIKNLSVYYDHPASVDIDSNGSDEFRFSNFFITQYGNNGGYSPGNVVAGALDFKNFFLNAEKLATGASIGANLAWINMINLNRAVAATRFMGHRCYTFIGFPFANATGYIGVKFTTSGREHYGWIQYHGVSTASCTLWDPVHGYYSGSASSTGTIIDWAYESTPNTPILAGDTDGDSIMTNDNCPTVYNPLQLDANGNGIGDSCDPNPGCGGCGLPLCEDQIGIYTDTDGDNWADVIDNCPAMYNPNQKDGDKDGIGDCCDQTPGCGGCGQPKCDTVCSK